MLLTDETFITVIATLKRAYLNWELPEDSVDTWKNTLAISVSEELLPKIAIDWVSNKTNPPKNPAEIIQYGREMFNKGYDSADTSAEIIISNGRNAYSATDDFLTFANEYDNSFASLLGTPAEEAYIVENIRKHSNNPKVLILVYDELKGDLKTCFTGDAEHGVEFLRNQIKKKWNEKMVNAATEYLKSGMTDFITNLSGSTGGKYGQLEA